MDLLHLPLDQSRADALIRDRLALEPAGLATLQAAIATDGLRQPVEVFLTDDTPPYALISGLRRLSVFRNLNALRPGGPWASIPAILRRPETVAQALAAMVSENEHRSQITPWEKGALVLRCAEEGVFPTLDASADALFPALTRQARYRLRGWAAVVQALDGHLREPTTLTARRMDRLAGACRGGLIDLMQDILSDHRRAAPETQWQALAPALVEAVLTEDDPDPVPGLVPGADTGRDRQSDGQSGRQSGRQDGRQSGRNPGRRILTLKSGVKLRREWTRDGWIIRLSGRNARHPAIVEDILDHVEHWFGEP